MPDQILAGDSVVYTFTEKVPSYIYNKLQLGVAAFVQDMGLPRTSQSVIQAVFATSPNVTDEVMVDNSTYPTGAAVCNESFTPTVQITNNGTTTLTSATVSYAIGSAPQVSQNWTGSLAAGQSTTVTFPATNLPDNTYGNAEYYLSNLNGGAIIDYNDANNTPESSFLISLPATAVMDTLSENFDESNDAYIGSVLTPISLNSTDPSDAFGFIIDESYIYNYIAGSASYMSSTSAVGGYSLSDASFTFALYYTAGTGQTDGLIFDKVNRLGYENSNLVFQHAYAGYGASADALNVLASTDCGQTWTTIWTKTGSALATSPDVNPADKIFVPTASQWVTDTLNVSAFNNKSDVIIQFQGVANGGNAIYIDNINWAQGNPLAVQNISNVTSSTVYPNPANGTVSLGLELSSADNFDITLVNTLGQTVKTVSTVELTAGNHNMDVNISDLSAGVYNFVIKSGNQSMVKRFVVTN
jgi:uncharacterized protein YceK